MAEQKNSSNGGQQGGGGGGGDQRDGRGQVVDPATDGRVDNKSGQMGKAFRDNPELAAAAGRKGGLHRRAGDEADPETEKQLDKEIMEAQGVKDAGGAGDKQKSESDEQPDEFEEELYDSDIPNFDRKAVEHIAHAHPDKPRRHVSQKEAVFSAVTEVLGKTEFEDAVEISKLSGDQHRAIRKKIFEQFKNGEVTFGGQLPDDKRLDTYSNGLLSNWLRKDRRLNGGERYQPQTSQPRAQHGDEQMKAMEALYAVMKDPQDKRKIREEMDKRQEQLDQEAYARIDASKLPESLKHMVPKKS